MVSDEWWFTGSPAEFQGVAGEFLATDPLQFTIMTTVLDRAVASGEDAGNVGRPYWFAALRDGGGRMVSAAMRTAPFVPNPLWLLPMPVEAARDLARIVVRRGEAAAGEAFGVNGALPAAQVCAAEVAAATGGEVHVEMHSRLFRLDEVVWPARPDALLRLATPEDVDLVVDWARRFSADADEQAGRPAGERSHVEFDEEWARDRIGRGVVGLLVSPTGEPLHMTGWNTPAYGVNRIGPVYTPPEHRGRGYAAWTVAQVSADLLADGVVPCLFTDQANPVSNRVYERIGYRPVVDTVAQTVR